MGERGDRATGGRGDKATRRQKDRWIERLLSSFSPSLCLSVALSPSRSVAPSPVPPSPHLCGPEIVAFFFRAESLISLVTLTPYKLTNGSTGMVFCLWDSQLRQYTQDRSRTR